MKNVSTILFGFVLLGNLVFAIEIKDISHAVDVAGKQRMYTQRMFKDYALIGQRCQYSDPRSDLNKTVEAFGEHLQALYEFNKEKATEESLHRVMELWKGIKGKLQKVPEKDMVSVLQKDIEMLLKESNTATGLFAKQTGKKSGEIINISGRQRMLSQRMAGLYMLKTWGVSDPEFKKKLHDAMDLFKNSHQKLSTYEKNTEEIKGLLSKVSKSFMYFEFADKSETFVPNLICKKAEEILKSMNTVTGLYAKQGAKESK
jgi:nitrate/nitrite-specific signal transduction histidine kinase